MRDSTVKEEHETLGKINVFLQKDSDETLNRTCEQYISFKENLNKNYNCTYNRENIICIFLNAY